MLLAIQSNQTMQICLNFLFFAMFFFVVLKMSVFVITHFSIYEWGLLLLLDRLLLAIINSWQVLGCWRAAIQGARSSRLENVNHFPWYLCSSGTVFSIIWHRDMSSLTKMDIVSTKYLCVCVQKIYLIRSGCALALCPVMPRVGSRPPETLTRIWD